MASHSGLLRLCGFSNISCRGLPIARNLVYRNLQSFSKHTSICEHKVNNVSFFGTVRKRLRSTLFSQSCTPLSCGSVTPILQKRSYSIFSGIIQQSKVLASTGHIVKPVYGNIGNTRLTMLARNINIMSKRGKRKTCKAVAKRVHRTGKGKLKRWRAGKNHGMIRKSNKRRKHLKKHTYCNKQQLKLLNKMLNGW